MQKVIQKRILFMVGGLFFIFPWIIFRLYCIQILNYDYYQNKAVSHLDKYYDAPPIRGRINDRNGVTLAETKIDYEIRFQLHPLRKDGIIQETPSMQNLSKVLNVGIDEIKSICSKENQKQTRRIRRKLNRHKYLFSLDLREFSSFDNYKLPLVLLQKFKQKKISLPPQFSLEIVKKNWEWILKKPNSEKRSDLYLVTRETKGEKSDKQELKVYACAKGKEARKMRRGLEANYYRQLYPLFEGIPKEIAIVLSTDKYKWKFIPSQFLFKIDDEHKSWLNRREIPPIIYQVFSQENFQEKFSYKLSRDVLVRIKGKNQWLMEDRRYHNQYAITRLQDKLHITYQANTKRVDQYKGFSIYKGISRDYPKKTLASHILGNMGEINREEYIQREKDYRMTDLVGRSGIEKVFENKLRGARGSIVDLRDSQMQFSDPPTDGMDLYLTIDSELQETAELALDESIKRASSAVGGGAVFIDIKTGEILVLATSPRYDNNRYRADYNHLIQLPEKPLENRAIYNGNPAPPGSIFKVITSLAVLEEKVASPSQVVYCRGYLHNPRAFRCTHHHSFINLKDSITQSCNIYFYKVGEALGESRLHQWGEWFGFGKRVGISLPGESKGFLPSAAWKRKAFNEGWNKGNSRMLAIGQLLEATPLQVARAMALVANEGAVPAVKLVKGFHSPNYQKEGSVLFTLQELRDVPSLLRSFQQEHKPVMTYLRKNFSSGLQQDILAYQGGSPSLSMQHNLVKELNFLLQNKYIYHKDIFHGMVFDSEIKALLQKKLSWKELISLNRLLLEVIFPFQIVHKRLVAQNPTMITPALTNNSDPLQQIPIHPGHLELIRQGMIGVVHSEKGTARNIRKLLPQGLIIASKTGTSQVRGKPDHAWFAGFAPAYRPQYAFAVYVEHGGYGGSVAAPVAAKVLQKLFE